MYVEKRWLVPAALTLLLLGALFAVVLLLSGSRIPQESGRGRTADIASVATEYKAPESVGGPAPSAPPSVVPAAEPAPPAAVAVAQDVPVAEPSPIVAEESGGTTSPEEVVGIATLASEDTQINTRGFGDIGMQFDDVNNSAPITIVHISSQGNNNTTNVNIGNNDQIVSKQEHLQSNRSDGSQPRPVGVRRGLLHP